MASYDSNDGDVWRRLSIRHGSWGKFIGENMSR